MRKLMLPIIALALYSCASSNANDNTAIEALKRENDSLKRQSKTLSSPQKIKLSLKEIEESKPLNYVDVQSFSFEPNKIQTKHSTWLREAEYKIDGYLLSGMIFCNSSIAVFKDPLIKIDYYSATGSIINSEEKRIYMFVNPNDSVSFEVKCNPPSEFVDIKTALKSIRVSK